MRLSSLNSSLRNLAFFLASLSLPSEIRAISFSRAPEPNLDLSQLGRVALAGDFDAISLYNYIGQNEDGLHTNGSQSLLVRFPDGGFASVKSADAYISSMCPFMSNGSLQGIVVGGNFTSIGGQQAQAAVLIDPNTGGIVSLSGLSGEVNSVFCDDSGGGTVYVGGSFSGGKSTNAIAWTNNWTNLPFAGFNGPVSTIAKLSNGHIIFGGSFTGIGNVTTPKTPNAQTVNIGSANITVGPNTTTHPGLDNPKNIICTNSPSQNPWLGADNVPTFWRADLGFSFAPTKLRLLNSDFQGYGTRTWRYTFFGSGNGLANFTYYDGGGLQSCTSECPLPILNSSYQDFYFVNPIMMSGFRIDISDWYGNGAGLGGIELFQDDIYSYAVSDFNEPHCDSVSFGSNSTVKGDWQTMPSGNSYSGYLSTYLLSGTTADPSDRSIVFYPDIKQSGNYSVNINTPGCAIDNTCSTRGSVNITGVMANPTGTKKVPPISTVVSQTNNYDKYDQIYSGYVDAGSGSFRPAITLTPSPNQRGPLTVVAQRLQLSLTTTTGGLNGLFEYDPSQARIDTDFSNSAIDKAGTQLNEGAQITELVVADDVTYAGGNFTTGSFSNIMSIDNGNSNALPGEGLNNVVQAMYNYNNALYIGGNFTNTRDNQTIGLNNIAVYSISDKTWHALGAGVNGPVWSVVPLSINVSNSEVADAIAFSGFFDQIFGFDRYSPIPVQSLAVWVPSRNNWLENIPTAQIALLGRLNAQTNVPGSDPLFAGTVDSQTLRTSGVVGVTGSSSPGLQEIPLNIQPRQAPPSNSIQKRTANQPQIQGVMAGLFYESNGLNLTILGGNFQAKANNGSLVQNLVLVNSSSGDAVTGLSGHFSPDAAIMALETSGTTLYAGGSIPGGFVAYDLAQGDLSRSQPASLTGGTGTVSGIASRPSSPAIYFAGSFTSAGSLPCPALCSYDTSMQQWNSPANGIAAGSVINKIAWATSSSLIIAGNMTINNAFTTMASFDAKGQSFALFQDAGNAQSVPGPITAFSATSNKYSSFFVAGKSSANGSAFISKFESKGSSSSQVSGTWTNVISPQQLGPATIVESLQILELSHDHDDSSLVSDDQSLLVTGLLEINGYGNASAALYNGTSFNPFALTTMSDGSPGSLYTAFVQNPQNLLNSEGSDRLATGFIILIALAIALALTFLMIVIGIIAERIRRRRAGYVLAPTSAPTEKLGNVGNISPQQLFGGVGGGAPGHDR